VAAREGEGGNGLLRFVGAAVLVAALAAACYALYGKLRAAPPAGAPAEGGFHGMPPAAVDVVEIVLRDVPLSFEYGGRAAGSQEIDVRSRVSGELLRHAYPEGKYVRKGDLMFEIDPAPLLTARAEAQARMTQAEREWKRVDRLFKQKAASDREHDEAEWSYRSAKALLETAEINLGYTKIYAPTSGIADKEAFSNGNLVVADVSVLTRIVQADPVFVNFAVSEADAAAAFGAPGGALSHLKASLAFEDGAAYPEEGVIDYADSVVDTKTGTVKMRAVFPNKNGVIRPGQFVRVSLKGVVRKEAIEIPDKAVMQGPQGPFVYAVTPDSKASVRPVVLGPLNGASRLIESGLKAGDKVVTEGMMKAQPDAPVAVGAPPPPPAKE
jgi:membrane fusion protein (multidrug efflux system)